jgi:Glycosyltransferase family 87
VRGRALKRRRRGAEAQVVGPLGGRLNKAALVVVALAISVHAALSVATLGDYAGDAGPALAALLHGDVHAFGHAHPAMGDVSLLARAPFAAIAYLGAPTTLNIYRWGSLPCVLSVAALALVLAGIARRRGGGPLSEWAIVLVSLINPMVASAIALGHPEELMTASLCIGALVAALEDRAVAAAVLLGLALACKQWALIAIAPVLLALGRERLRALLGALALALLVTLPEALASPAAFLANQLSLAHHASRHPPAQSWLWPLASRTVLHIRLSTTTVPVTVYSLPNAVAQSAHAVMILVNLALAGVVACVRRIPLRRDEAFALMSATLLIRSSLEVSATYYYTAFLLGLVAWDALRGERLPIRSLTATVAAYVLLDRMSTAPGTLDAASVLCALCTISAMALFARTLFARRGSSTRGLDSRRALAV